MNILKALLLVIVSAPELLGQGTIRFENRGLRDTETQTFYDAPVSLPDGTRIAGPGFTAGLFLVEDSSLRLVGTSTFRTGLAAGFFIREDITIQGTFGPVTLRARVWETAAGSYESAIIQGRYYGEFPTRDPQNNIYVENLGGPPPFPEAAVDGILPFTLVPEPSFATIVFAGVTILFASRSPHRRKSKAP